VFSQVAGETTICRRRLRSVRYELCSQCSSTFGGSLRWSSPATAVIVSVGASRICVWNEHVYSAIAWGHLGMRAGAVQISETSCMLF
jgi:hypothetical protein